MWRVPHVDHSVGTTVSTNIRIAMFLIQCIWVAMHSRHWTVLKEIIAIEAYEVEHNFIAPNEINM